MVPSRQLEIQLIENNVSLSDECMDQFPSNDHKDNDVQAYIEQTTDQLETAQMDQFLHQPTVSEAHLSNAIIPAPAKAGMSVSRKRVKSATPNSTAGLRRGLRSDKDGYVEMALPYQPSRRKPSSVPLAHKPEVMQIKMMQKIGVEQCQVDPGDLTKEILHRPRH
jgi:hypothetical protein